MNDVVASIYITLSVTTIIIFLLTRKINLRVIKNENLIFSIGFTLVKIEITKDEEINSNNTMVTSSGESETSADFSEFFSLFTTIFHYFKKCTIIIRRITIPGRIKNNNIYTHFILQAMLSTLIAYIESNVEKLTITNNAFTLSSDGKFEFDINLGIILFDLITLIAKLTIKGIKLGRAENVNVGN